MARTKGDHEARRRDVSEAVWRVLAVRGFGGLTMRAVAAELGATTGLLTHYFPAKRDLVAHALELLDRRSAARPRRVAGEGLAALRAALLDVLPLTDEATDGNRIWVSSWDTALADPALCEDYARKYARSRDKLSDLVAAAQRLGELPAGDPARVAAGAQAFVLGLVVQALLDPEAFPPQRQIDLLDDHLAASAAMPMPAVSAVSSAMPVPAVSAVRAAAPVETATTSAAAPEAG
ncbi:TetR/AcrR family transcriptional regulator [Streptomyces sp. NPDC014734]|uniref:TetR/AcrR family transcriptional regulator n=1 Tax=Streptomyces sp. NPDC014734 TaxID=3364886 RepID=UPI0036FB2A8B